MSTGTGGSLHLLGSRLNLAYIWESSREELRTILGSPDTKKVSISPEIKFCVCVIFEGYMVTTFEGRILQVHKLQKSLCVCVSYMWVWSSLVQ